MIDVEGDLLHLQLDVEDRKFLVSILRIVIDHGLYGIDLKKASCWLSWIEGL